MKGVIDSISGVLLGIASVCAVAADDTLKIAFLVPLSGSFANVGETQMKHAHFFADRLNARGGVLGGRKLEIVPMDNKNSPQEAVLLVSKIADRGIRFVSHCCASHVAVALSDAIEKHNSRQPDRSMLLFVEVGDWDVVNEKCSFWTPDIQIVGDDLFALAKVKDFAPYVAKIRASKADAVFTGNWGPDLVLFIKAAAESGLGVPVYAPAGFLWGTVTALGQSGVDRVKASYRWHPNLGIGKEQLAMEEFARRFNSQYYAMPSGNEIEMLAQALDKAGSADLVRVAYALEGSRIEGNMGEVWMAPENHQLHEPLYVMTLSAVDGREVKYGMEGSNIGTRTEARLEASSLISPLRCQMKRPPMP